MSLVSALTGARRLATPRAVIGVVAAHHHPTGAVGALLPLPRHPRAVTDDELVALVRAATEHLATALGTELAPPVRDAALTQVALLLRCLAPVRVTDPRLASATTRLVAILQPHLGWDHLVDALCRRPGRALEDAAVYLVVRDLGHTDRAVDAVLGAVLDGPDAEAPSRSPLDELEQQWLRGIWSGSPTTSPDEEEAIARSPLAGSLDHLDEDPAERMALARALLHATDLGRRQPDWPRSPHELEQEVEASLVAALDDDDLALAAELLWCWPLLRLPWSPLASFVFGLLENRTDDDAHAGPTDRTTLALGLLAACTLATDHRPSRTRPRHAQESRPAAAPAALEAMVDRHDAEPRWLAAYRSTAAVDRAPLARSILTSLVLRARRDADHRRLQELLCLALELGLADTLAVRQGVTHLRRRTLAAQAHRGVVADRGSACGGLHR